MFRQPAVSTRTDTLFPDSTRFRSRRRRAGLAERQAAPAKRNAAYGVAGLAEHALRRPTLRPLSCGGARWQPRLRGSPLSRASAEWRQLSDAGSGLFTRG